MSEIRLNVCDSTRALHRTIHASRVDYVVAALSADPETIDELQAALARFQPADGQRGFFADWTPGKCLEPWDAGVAIIDLAALLVIVQSSYSAPGPRGEVATAAAHKDQDVWVPYHIADDWKFTGDLDGAQGLAEERRRMRLGTPPVDTRAVLYGKVCAFIVEACRTAAPESAPAIPAAEAVPEAIAAFHARWLTTPRTDLGGLAPRDVLLARRDHLAWDLQDRAEQWTMLNACPPGLSHEAAAYRTGGFGTHEIVLYYDLVRFLLDNCFPSGTGHAHVADVGRLEALRDEWLETPEFEMLQGRTPASVIARERARLPEAVTGHDAMVDHDCPLCRMLADSPGPMFWNLDGCNMDDDFAFSFHRTREAWEAERRKWEDFNRRFAEKERLRAADPSPSVWRTSFVDSAAAAGSAELTLFGLGAHLAELTQDLKDAAADQGLLDGLNRAFGNLDDVVVLDPSAALVEPAIARLGETLAGAAEAYPALTDKCADLERQLFGLAGRLGAEPLGDDDLPF